MHPGQIRQARTLSRRGDRHHVNPAPGVMLSPFCHLAGKSTALVHLTSTRRLIPQKRFAGMA
jgi:hypothetical protein